MAEMPINLPAPGYFIYRDTQLLGEAVDPAAPPVFFPPKDSDELFDALRAKYPYLKTHSERTRDAIIEFLLEEREAEMLSSETNLETPTTISPWQNSQSWPSMSNGSTSTLTSPGDLALTTPTFEPYPEAQLPQRTRQHSTAASTITYATEVSPCALEQMTGVFSVSSADQPKQRVRRKMTDAEKQEYRQRRIVKACEKCQKRKRKCIHNQSGVEALITTSQKKLLTSKTHRQTTEAPKAPSHVAAQSGNLSNSPHLPQPAAVTKPTGVTSVLQEQNDLFDFDVFDFGDTRNTDMQLFDDFTTGLLPENADLVPQTSFDQHTHFDPTTFSSDTNTATGSHDGRGQLRWAAKPLHDIPVVPQLAASRHELELKDHNLEMELYVLRRRLTRPHTRPSGTQQMQQHAVYASMTPPIVARMESASARAGLQVGHDGDTIGGSSTGPVVYQARLRDTFRRKDHFGRSAAPAVPSLLQVHQDGRREVASTLLAMLGCLLVAACFSLPAGLALLPLALLCPVGGEGEGPYIWNRRRRAWDGVFGLRLWSKDTSSYRAVVPRALLKTGGRLVTAMRSIWSTVAPI
ncbi:hypothetical protein LTR08_004105 [Meristemomyces frigidus]|nr:hypothetical protein LTR08_004105 [Meristemomyces frigidus]